MKKALILLLCVCMAFCLFGCDQDTDNVSTVSLSDQGSSSFEETNHSNSTTIAPNGNIETTLVEGDVFEAVSSIDSSVELLEIRSPSAEFNNLLIDIKPLEEDLESAFTTYLRTLKNITLQSYPAFVDKKYTHVLLRYCPTHSSADLPGLGTFSFKLEPINDKYRLPPDSIGDTISEYITTLANEQILFEDSELSEDQLNCILKAIEKEKITELYNIE